MQTTFSFLVPLLIYQGSDITTYTANIWFQAPRMNQRVTWAIIIFPTECITLKKCVMYHPLIHQPLNVPHFPFPLHITAHSSTFSMVHLKWIMKLFRVAASWGGSGVRTSGSSMLESLCKKLQNKSVVSVLISKQIEGA